MNVKVTPAELDGFFEKYWLVYYPIYKERMGQAFYNHVLYRKGVNIPMPELFYCTDAVLCLTMISKFVEGKNGNCADS